jgi:hypothetical protein
MRLKFIAFLIISQTADAQHKLLLNAGKFSNTSTRQHFEIVDVKDVRADKSNIGVLFNPATEKLDSITTDKPLTETLLSYFDLCENKSEKQVKLCLSVNFLQFGYRKIKNKEYVWAFCDYSAFSKKDNGVCLLKREVCAVEGKIDDYGIVSNLSKINWQLWNEIFGQINDFKFDDTQLNIWPETILYQPVSMPKVTLADTLRTGIYANFDEFVNDKPSVTDFSLTIKAPPPNYRGKIRLKFQIKESRESGKMINYALRNIWGYCQYNRIYVRIDRRQFLEIQPLGTLFEIANSSVKAFQPQLIDSNSNILPPKGFNPPEGVVPSTNMALLFVGGIAGNSNWRVLITSAGLRLIPIYNLK